MIEPVTLTIIFSHLVSARTWVLEIYKKYMYIERLLGTLEYLLLPPLASPIKISPGESTAWHACILAMSPKTSRPNLSWNLE